jgi:hypothetical protein
VNTWGRIYDPPCPIGDTEPAWRYDSSMRTPVLWNNGRYAVLEKSVDTGTKP